MFIIEGNIGAGKSTFLKLIEKHLPHITAIFEPIQSWHNNEGQSLLEKFYQNPQRWAYTMETLTLISRVQEHLKEQEHPNPYRLMERSIYSGHYCFATNDYRSGYLTDLEWNLYLEWFNYLVSEHCKIPHGFIYLRVDPEIAFERIQKRDRTGENTISLDYLKQIHDAHENFLVQKINVLQELNDTPVLILDCNQDFEVNKELFLDHASTIIAFMRANARIQKHHSSQTYMQYS